MFLPFPNSNYVVSTQRVSKIILSNEPDDEMALSEHIEEFSQRLIFCFGVLALITIACFTDIKVRDDMKVYSLTIEDSFLEQKIKSMKHHYDKYLDLEQELQLNTGLDYDNALIYDMVEFSMSWCECDTEEKCKYFIQNDVYNKTISVGDFTKAMLKIVTISKEFINVCEQLNLIELQHKLSQIEDMVLKYITTSQSLYV